jgi:agmatine deiminase
MTPPAEPAHPYLMPAEWEPHRSTWLAWPHRKSDWPGKFAPVPTVYAEIVKKLSGFEEVNILVPDELTKARVEKSLRTHGVNVSHVSLWVCPTDRSWVRDSGPIFVRDPKKRIVALDWHFNAWAKYSDWTLDDQVPKFVAQFRERTRVQPVRRGWRVVLEGGSIDVNGQGLMLTTEECLLSTVQQRNPPFDRTDYEAVFDEYLGVKEVLWLNRGILGDDTHGHVDDLARFVNPTTVVAVVEQNPNEENYAPLQENLDRLRGFTARNGQKLTVVPLPMPQPLHYDGVCLPASYANFYIANGIVLVPTFNDPADRVALGTLAELFPDRQVVGIHCGDLVWGLGTLHCMTQQEPA